MDAFHTTCCRYFGREPARELASRISLPDACIKKTTGEIGARYPPLPTVAVVPQVPNVDVPFRTLQTSFSTRMTELLQKCGSHRKYVCEDNAYVRYVSLYIFRNMYAMCVWSARKARSLSRRVVLSRIPEAFSRPKFESLSRSCKSAYSHHHFALQRVEFATMKTAIFTSFRRP